MTYTYDARGNKTSETNALGATTTYVYNDFGNKVTETDALGHQINYKYDANGRETEVSQKVTFADGVRVVTTKKTYDAKGNITSETDAEGNTVQYRYNKNGKRILTIDPLNRQTVEVYDDNDRLIKMVSADGLTNEYTYDAQGNRLSSKDRDGQTTYYTYDAMNRPTALIAPDNTPDNPNDNLRKLITYDKVGSLTSLTDERGQTTTFDYDLVGNQIWTRSYDGTTPIVTTATFDQARRRTSVTDAFGRTTRYIYDGLGRLISTIYADGLSEKITYNALGKEIIKVNRAGNATTYDYDPLQHLIAVTLPTVDGAISKTQYRYDERGLLINQIDALQHETKYEYDSRGLRTAVIRPEGQRSSINYNVFGNIISATDFNGVTTGYTYDNMNRLITQQRNGQTVASYTYTANGQKATITDMRGTTAYTYRPEGQLTKVLSPDGTFVSYTYDGAELRSVTTPYDTTTYSYDSQARLKTVTAHGKTTTYSYDLLGNQIGFILANGIQETRSYDILNRLTQIRQTNTTGQVLAEYKYTFDAMGNRVQVLEKDRQVDFTYDARDRLVKEVVTTITGAKTTSYILDAVSNRLSKNDSETGLTTYLYNANDLLLTEVNGAQSTTYTYDANGNNTAKISVNNNPTTYTWNADNRLVGISTNGHQYAYEYDLAGMRTSQTIDGVRTNYLLDVNRSNPVVVAEYNQPAISTVTYTYGANLISQQQGVNESFFLSDGHSGVRILTDSLGNSTSTSSYDAYGNVSYSGSNNPYLYRGEQFDQQTQLQYLRARYYDPSTGRFLGVDPFEGNLNDPVSRHRYLYGNANPISYSDPSGKFSIAEVTATVLVFNILSVVTHATVAQLTSKSRNKELVWSGWVTSTGFSSELIGVPSLLATTIAGATLTSDCYNGTTTSGAWLLLGLGVSVAAPFNKSPVSLTSNSLTISSPYKLGNDSSVLSGIFNSVSLGTFLPGYGFSFTHLFMGFGYSIANPDPGQNQSIGWDFGVGITSGISVNIFSNSAISSAC